MSAKQLNDLIIFEKLDALERLSIIIPYRLYDIIPLKASPIASEIVPSMFLVSVATICVAWGSYSTLGKPLNAIDPNEDRRAMWDVSDNDGSTAYKSTSEELEDMNSDTLGWKSVISLHAMECIALCGLYYGFKHFNKDQLERYLFQYIIALSFFSTSSMVNLIMAYITRKIKTAFKKERSLLSRYRLTLSRDVDDFPLGIVETVDRAKHKEAIEHLKSQGVKFIQPNPIKPQNQILNYFFDLKFLLSVPLASALCFLFYKHNPVTNESYSSQNTNWLLVDTLGITWTVLGIRKIRLPSFKICYFSLLIWLIYDIYFVFGTDIMTTVATSYDLPLKFVFPRSPSLGLEEILKHPAELYSSVAILGLGDIVVPGILASFCLRFDLYRFYEQREIAFHFQNKFPKPYFWTSLISYVVGLAAAASAAQIYAVGQPALLYIIPSMAISILVVGKLRGELSTLFAYTESLKPLPPSESVSLNDESGENMEQDEDYSVGEDSEWERIVEEHLELDEDFADTDLDEIDLLIQDQGAPIQLPITYEFDSDDDDDTFIIESGDSSLIYSDSGLSSPHTSDDEDGPF